MMMQLLFLMLMVLDLQIRTIEQKLKLLLSLIIRVGKLLFKLYQTKIEEVPVTDDQEVMETAAVISQLD